MTSYEFLIYLLAMVILVPIAKQIGLGSVIGYLGVGVLMGPFGLSLFKRVDDGPSKLAELGVIMMLLLIGLELNPRLLWKMRGPVIGLGSLQMLTTTAIFSAVLLAVGVPLNQALALGLVVSVSSTAISLQTLQEQGYAKSVGGEKALAVLLFQDLAVIPILALLPFLGAKSNAQEFASPWTQAILIFGAVATISAAGRFLIRPLFKLISRSKLRETFTALALLIVVSASALMHAVGLSPAFGAFLAGVVLADSEYRHQIEADIEPFKGLLLGLFFVTIGSTIQFTLIMQKPASVAGWLLAIMFGKSIITYALGRFYGLRPPENLLFSVALAQGGEFAFVILAQSQGLIDGETAQILTAAIVLSMALAPLLIKLAIHKGMSRFDCVKAEDRLPDTVDESEKDNAVLVIGIGRFGQTFVRFLRANGISSTVLDIDSEQIEIMARFGIKSYFGDGSNLDLLRAAGLDRAKALVIAIDEAEVALRLVATLRPHYPDLPIFSRVYDRLHAYQMIDAGVTEVAIETSGSAIYLATELLMKFGMNRERAAAKAQLFYINNQHSIHVLSKKYKENDGEDFFQASRQMADQLEAMLRSDPEELLRNATSEWPRKPLAVENQT